MRRVLVASTADLNALRSRRLAQPGRSGVGSRSRGRRTGEVAMSTTVETGTAIRPFQVEFQEEQIDELRRRIAATRWPSKELVADRSQGVQLAATQALARYWLDEYDFGRIEARLNALPQFMTEIDGVDIHFIHVTSPARGRPAADHHPRLAGLGDRATRRHRPADRSHRPRRPGRGRVRRRHPLAARLRLLRASRRSSAGLRPPGSRRRGRS